MDNKDEQKQKESSRSTFTSDDLLSSAFEETDNALDGSQIVSGKWYIPKFGCDTLQVFILAAQGKVALAIDAEPELTDGMPKEMSDAILEAIENKDVDLLTEAMRIIVRLTKKGISDRLGL